MVFASMKDILEDLRKDLNLYTSPQKAEVLKRFFKTGKGQYGEGDIFLGVQVPDLRKIVRKYANIPLDNTLNLLRSKIHEERLIALLIMVEKTKWADEAGKETLFKKYLENTQYINNWDLVDLSADKIVGSYLFEKPKDILYSLAVSENLWERRIAILATFDFIKKGFYEDTLKLAKILLNDRHDLIHKAVGWMLREIGKRCSQEVLEQFLLVNYKQMPRTMLRYAIERLPEDLRLQYLNGEK
ncbi:MAG: DNA alkylation repair protein [Actinobacteria bacterium]|nr:DNA alkylation repair protein [Actinomycetota bacterium]